jgi:hypothetical protein
LLLLLLLFGPDLSYTIRYGLKEKKRKILPVIKLLDLGAPGAMK